MSTLSRRAVLRGAGAALALPWLESLPAFADTSAALPQRFAVLFMGNGISGNHWWAKGAGAEMTLGRSLAPLEPFKLKLNVINGLFNQVGFGKGIHPAQTGNLLSGVPLQGGGALRECADPARSGITIDQLLADHLAHLTPRPSLTLSCEPPVGGVHDSGYALAYSSHIAWRNTISPVPNEFSARRAFDLLFEHRQRPPNASIIDRLSAARRRLNRRIAAADRTRVDAYLTDVRSVETRLARPQATAGAAGGDSDIRDHARLMCDIIALAFQSDNTRVASLILARDLSSLRYPFLDGVTANRDHHAMSHDDLSDGYERIVRFHVGQLAYLAARLDAMPEGGGTVLDNTCLLWLSNMWSGFKHDNMKLPVVTVGGLGGTIETGRALEYLYGGDDDRRLCSLYLSILQKMGVAIERFGDAATALQGF